MRITPLSPLVLALCLGACGQTDRNDSELERRRHEIECRNKFCEGDIEPKVDKLRFEPFKIGGIWLVAPRVYGGFNGSLAFFWPSKAPARGPSPPEFFPSSGGKISNFYDVAIEVFIRERNRSSIENPLYEQLMDARKEGRVLSVTRISDDLEVWRIRQGTAAMRNTAFYVADNLKGVDGYPPVLACRDTNPRFDRCSMAFYWMDDFSVDLRLSRENAGSWPSIYQEVIRVLGLVERK